MPGGLKPRVFIMDDNKYKTAFNLLVADIRAKLDDVEETQRKVTRIDNPAYRTLGSLLWVYKDMHRSALELVDKLGLDIEEND